MSSAGSGDVAGQKKPCLACGVISGTGLTGAGIYVFIKLQKFFLPGTSSPFVILPIVFSVGLTAVGITHLTKTGQHYLSSK